jgi:micrococcal nuclease|tara:strand:- start:6139 stop:6510 length:372 start_codon:yes stop_codon:yes gene_type:complete
MTKEKLFHYSAKVDRVVDGDTIDVTLDLGFDIYYKARVRFYGINTPESRTRDLVEKKAGLAAKQYVLDWAAARDNSVIIQTTIDDKGKYGRVLGTILDREGGESLNDKLIDDGHAVAYFGGKR